MTSPVRGQDKRSAAAGGPAAFVDTEIGRGTVSYPALFAALKQARWSGIMAIETDSNEFAANPGPFVDQAREFFSRNR